jgi:two-component system sensor histidine kinase AtoS
MVRLELRELRASHGGRRVIEGISLSVEGGEVRALIGERRAGKTSLVRLIAGCDRPDRGEIRIDGVALVRPGPRAANLLGVGVLFQESLLVPSLSAAENILAGRRKFGLGRSAAIREAEAIFLKTASRWGLRPDPGVRARRLSTLECSAAELARATAFDPAVLVLDEPAGRFTADEMQVLYEIVGEAKAAGMAVLYVASTVDEVLRVADRVSIMKGGRILETLDVTSLDREALVDLAYAFTESREELVRKNFELLKYRRYNEEIISNLPLGTVILDTEGRVYLANGAARLFLSAAEGPDLEDLLAKVDAGPREEISRAVRDGRRAEWSRVPVEGGRTLSLLAFPFHDAAGRALGTILALEDISEELATREYLAHAERSDSIAELAAGVAHEVNNPLAIISNYVELLLMRPQEDYTADRLAIVRSEIKRIHGIVASLLSFARIGSVLVEEADLVTVARDSILLLSHEVERRGVDLELSLPQGPLLARVDPSRLKQIIINLVVNALEALTDGGRVLVSLSSTGDAAELVVEDDGPGIDDALFAGLFKPFAATTKGPSHAGLGLSVCKHIAEAHGGSIRCRSEPGRTVFAVSLPLAGPPGSQDPGQA